MQLETNRSSIYFKAGRVGVISLFCTFFLLSFPRSWSLYPLGLFLFCGLLLWISDFRLICSKLLSLWVFILPPVLYFLIHLLSVILQNAELNILTNRLMFILIPLLGFPVFIHDTFKKNSEYSLKIFIAGLFIVSVFLITRIIIISIIGAGQGSILDFVKNNNEDLFSLGFSILEHPTYMSLKVNFTILLLLLFKNKWQLKNIYFISSLIVLAVVIFLLASKAGIIVFMIIVISVMIRIASTGVKKIITYLLLIPTFIFLSFSIVKNIDRIEWFIHYTELELKSENGDLKKYDQRMREWYTAIQLIKEKPFTGFGLANIEKRMVEEYLRYGFEEEAKLKMNAHNQYLEAQMTFGIAGSISLLMMLLIPLIYRKQIRYPRLMTIFIAMVSFFLMFESMFNRQWGIMFFLLFYCILCLGEENVNI